MKNIMNIGFPIRLWGHFLVLCSLILMIGCASTSVERRDEGEPVDLSGRWNDTDSRLVSRHMIERLLEDSWLMTYRSRYQRNPVISIGRVENRTTEHIATDTFTNDIELALLTSKRVDLAAAGKTRQGVRKERKDYVDHNQDPAGTRIFAEKRVDFVLSGAIYSIEDQVTDTSVVTYQVDLKLVSFEDNEMVWAAQKKIKKVIKKQSIGW